MISPFQAQDSRMGWGNKQEQTLSKKSAVAIVKFDNVLNISNL